MSWLAAWLSAAVLALEWQAIGHAFPGMREHSAAHAESLTLLCIAGAPEVLDHKAPPPVEVCITSGPLLEAQHTTRLQGGALSALHRASEGHCFHGQAADQRCWLQDDRGLWGHGQGRGWGLHQGLCQRPCCWARARPPTGKTTNLACLAYSMLC